MFHVLLTNNVLVYHLFLCVLRMLYSCFLSWAIWKSLILLLIVDSYCRRLLHITNSYILNIIIFNIGLTWYLLHVCIYLFGSDSKWIRLIIENIYFSRRDNKLINEFINRKASILLKIKLISKIRRYRLYNYIRFNPKRILL